MQSLFPTVPSAVSDDDLAHLYAYPGERRWVRANFVTTLDGAAQGPDNKSGSLSSRADQRVFALLRSLADVIVVGASTARNEGYQPVEPSEVTAAVRVAQGLTPVPALAVVSRSLDLDAHLVAGGAAPTIVITTGSAPADRRRQVEEVAPVIVAGESDVDLGVALDSLAERGYHRMLCEGGPSIMRALIADDLLDELCLTITPRLVAGDPLRITHGPPVDPPRTLVLRQLLESDGELFARYTRG